MFCVDGPVVQQPCKGSLVLIHRLFWRRLWMLVGYVDAWSHGVDELPMSGVHAFLFPTSLYTALGMASNLGNIC